MFRGANKVTLDAKGRVAMPAAWHHLGLAAPAAAPDSAAPPGLFG